MLQLATNLPDARVRFSPVLERGFDLLAQDGPDAPIEVVSHLRVEIDGVEKRTPDVVLHLAVRSVADTHRSRTGIPRQVVERGLGEFTLPPDPVHDLQVVVALGDVGDEGEEVDGLPVEAERVHPPQRERRVPDPRVAVVVVARAADRLGQRRGRGRRYRPRRRVRQPLEGERAALEVAAPRMVGEAAPSQPVLPVVRRPLEPVDEPLRSSTAGPARPRTGRRSAHLPP